MDPVREALLLVADGASSVRLVPPDELRELAEQGRRRRRAAGALVGVAAAATVVWIAAVGPWVRTGADPAPIDRPAPTPTTSTLLWTDGCGLSRACPEGSGPFRFVLRPELGGDQLAVDVTLPDGWGVRHVRPEMVRLSHLPFRPESATPDPAGVAVLWPVARHGGTSSANAESLAQVVAAMSGSTSATPQRVSFGGHPGWRVRLEPAASTPGAACLDPTATGQGGRSDSPCRVLFDLLARDVAHPRTTIGVGGATTVELTFVDGADVLGAGTTGVAAVLHWGDPATAAWPEGASVANGLRWATYTDPFCGGDGAQACPPQSGDAEVRGDPISTLDGIHDWRAHATVALAPGWSVMSDDARGHVALVRGQDVTSFLTFVWQPGPPSGGWSATDAHAFATAMLHRAHLTATKVRATTIGGRPAWTVDVAVRQDIPEAGVPCPGRSTAYAVALECSGPGPNPYGTVLDSNDQARIWFVQADPTHVLMVIAEGKKIHIGQPAILPTAIAATASMIDSLRISTTR